MKGIKRNRNEKGKMWLKEELRPYRSRILFLTALTVAATVLSLAFAYLTQYLVNSASAGDERKLLFFSVVLLSVLLGRIVLQTAASYLSEKARARIAVGLRQKLFAKALKADYSCLEKYHSGDLLNRLTSDVAEVAYDHVSILPSTAGMVVQCAGAVGALLTLDIWFTVIFVVCGLAVGGLMALCRRKMKRYHKELSEEDGKSRSFIQESFSASLTLKAYGAEEKTAEKSRGILEGYYRKRMKRNRLNSYMGGVFSLLSNAGFIFAIVWCGVRIMRGTMDYGSILSIVLLLGQLQRPFSSFSSVLALCYAREAGGERLAEVDELPAEESGTASALPLYTAMKGIRLENLGFDYDGREKLLSGVNAEIEKGRIVCVTGGSGCGKSTLFKLLLNVYPPTEGGIYIVADEGAESGRAEKTAEDERQGYGASVSRPLTVKDRGLFAYVPQGNFLFSGSIYENLTFFSEEKDAEKLDADIRAALKIACAEFVWDLPEKLDTPLRERGGGLSEGQLQRLAVARALLSGRPVLLLDEATSALDEETEKNLLENIGRTEGKTCLIVTHRPAALKIADKVLHMENGKIEER